MFRRALRPTFQHLTDKCVLFDHHIQPTTLFANLHKQRQFSQSTNQVDGGGGGGAKYLKIFLASFATGTALLYYYDFKNKPKSIQSQIEVTNKQWDSVQRTINDDPLNKHSLIGHYVDASILDTLKIDKSIAGKNKLPKKRLVLLQYTNCPFCCKVRTFLNFYGIPYDIVEVNPLTRRQIKFSKYRKVPILLVEDESLRKESNRIIQLNDSSSIISVLGTYLLCNSQKDSIESIINKYETLQYTNLSNQKTIQEISNKYFLLYGDSVSEKEFKKMENQLLNERKFRKWTDDVLVHVLSPNIYRSTSEALQAFEYFSKVSDWEQSFTSIERLCVIYFGSFAMYVISKWLRKKYNLKEDVRQSLYDECNYFLRAKGSANQFLGGSEPNLSDLSVFGVLSSIEGCDAFKDLVKNTKIQKWYFTMKEMVEQKRGSDLLKISNNLK